MNNIFNRTNLKNFIYKKTPNIRDILKTSLNIYHKKNKNTYIPKIISNIKKTIFINYLNNLNNLINIINLNTLNNLNNLNKYSLQKNLYLNE